MNRYRVIGVTMITFILLAVITGCGTDEDPPEAFIEAEETGLIMDGYQDTEGLKRIVEHYLNEGLAPGSVIDDELANELGTDIQAIREIESLIRGMDFSIYRVEFIPDPTGAPEPDAPPLGIGESWGLGDETLMPEMPTRGSLVSQDGTNSGSRWSSDFGQGGVRIYPDGSSWYFLDAKTADGGRFSHVNITNPDGTLRHNEIWVRDANGEVVEHAVVTKEEGPSNMAYEDRQERIREAEGGSEGPQGDGDDSDVDEYQPAEGGNGTFCPLVVEICRRGFDEAIASGESVRVGVVLINPGDPDDQPTGSRLVFDPESLVINPDPEGAGRDASQVDPRAFKMVLPVWVNPPGPGER